MPEGPRFHRISERLAGHHLLVTGSTGFLAKALVEKLLRSVETVGGLHLMVRPRPGGASASQRVAKSVLGSHAFDRLRATLGDEFGRRCDAKIHVVSGDLTKEQFGLDPRDYEALTRRITLVVNSAATVTFDERLDLAVELNSLGPSRLLRFARDCGGVPFMHVSTCYVCGVRRGMIGEDLSAPEAARETLPRGGSAGEFDLDGLVETMLAEARALREEFGTETEACRRRLIELGMQRARQHGWNDTYTFTKWIGEQLLVRDRGDVPLVVFRPAIIESSYEEPAPGWIDGLRMADPVIVAYGRGKLSEFPGVGRLPIDLIPVDFVANAMIATFPVGEGRDRGLAVYQCASSGRNPLHIQDMGRWLREAFLKRPMNGDDGRPIHPARMHLLTGEVFVEHLLKKRRLVARLRRWLEPFHSARRRVRKLAVLARQIEQLLYFAKIYTPYTHLECRFSDDALRRAGEMLHPDDKTMFPFDVERIRWDDYLIDRHVPGVRSFVLGTGAEPSARIIGGGDRDRADAAAGVPVLTGESVFGVFEGSAKCFRDKPALQIRRNGRWLRYTYDEALRATGTIMRRFGERGLGPGDRVAICGESGPEWGLTYLGAMRAGLTAVPLDPQLPPTDAWAAARFTEAKLMCASPATLRGLADARGEFDPEVVTMAQPFVPPPAASRDHLPDPVPIEGNAIASILFTSGTTVTPKAVPLTHDNLIANATALRQVHPAHPNDEFLSVLPMYHAFEFTGGFLTPLASGATVTYVESLKGSEIRGAMQATGTTVMLVVPRLLRMFHDAITNKVATAGLVRRGLFRILGGLSALTRRRFARQLFRTVHGEFGGRLRMLVSGGSRLDPELFDAFQRLGFSVYEGYGLTETAPVLAVNPAGDSRAGSVGCVLPGVEIEIRNKNLEGIGEVWVKGPNVMSGYLNNLEATQEVLVDGWFRTEDLGRVDEDGYLYLTGRSKDLIITGAGKNVYPDEVEVRYQDLPYVRELCVFGMPSADGLGDVVHAVVVVDRDAAPEFDPSSTEREIRLGAEAISESLPPHERIAVLHFWDRELPKTSTLKAKRNLIREMVAVEEQTAAGGGAGELRTAPGAEGLQLTAGFAPAPETFAALRAILARQSKLAESEIRRFMHLLLDLGIDSIGKMDVLGAIETRFGMMIDDDQAAKIARVSDLLRLIGERKPKKGALPVRSSWPRRLGAPRQAASVNGQPTAALVPVRWLVRGSLHVFMNSYVRVHVSGRENIPTSGPFILAPNHSSHLDTPSVLTAIGGKRRVWIAGAEDYFFNTRLKQLLFGKVFDMIAFDRRADGLRGLRRCGEAISCGDGLLIFPEGTRSITGEIQPFKIGVAVLAVERRAPIVPVRIRRAYDLFRKGQRFVRPGTVAVRFGAPIQPPELDDTADHYAAFRALTDQVEAAVATMNEEVSA